MRNAPRPLALALTLCLALLRAPTLGATVLTNGDFESGPTITAAQQTQTVSPGSTALTGWSVINSAITIVTDGYWSPQSGHRSIELSASAPGGVTQSFASVPNATYHLTFWLSGEPFTTPALKHLRVQAGSLTQDYTFDNTEAWHWDMKWAQHTLDFLGTGTSTALTFTSQDAGSWGPAIDNVTLDGPTVGVEPAAFQLALSPVAPDPLRDAGRVAFTLPSAQPVRLSVFDIQGREIDVLADGMLDAGPHELRLAPRGAGARTGLFFLVLRAEARTFVRRFTVLR